MSLALRAGSRLRSVTCETEVVVVKAPTSVVDLRCGGTPMITLDDPAGVGTAPTPPFAGGTLLGKRYVTGDGGLEVLCTKAGDGSLTVGDEPLEVKGVKPLPSSD